MDLTKQLHHEYQYPPLKVFTIPKNERVVNKKRLKVSLAYVGFEIASYGFAGSRPSE